MDRTERGGPAGDAGDVPARVDLDAHDEAERRREDAADAAGPGPGRATVAVLLVAVAVLAAALAGPFDPEFLTDRVPRVRVTPSLPTLPVAENPFLEMEDTGPPPDLTWVGLVLAAVLLLAVLLLLARRMRRLAWLRRGEGGAPDDAGVGTAALATGPGSAPDLPTLREGVEDAAQHLRTLAAPADAVIAAWVSLEHAAGRSGVRRDPAHTPTEFTVQVLDRTAADRDATRTLTDLYLRARFGDEPVGPADVDTAVAALDVLARTLDGDPA